LIVSGEPWERILSRKLNIAAAAALALTLALVMANPASAVATTATRTLPSSVESGAEFEASIQPSGCGSFGQVVETLPEGFTYLSVTPEYIGIEQGGNVVKFTFLGSEGFTYTAEAPTVSVDTTYTFQGKVKDEDKNEYPFEDSTITVNTDADDQQQDDDDDSQGSYTIQAELFGDQADFFISASGEIGQDITVASADEDLTVTIPAGTVFLDEDDNPLLTLTMTVATDSPSPPDSAHIIGLAYDLGPDGATFDPPIILEYVYNPGDIPQAVDEEEMVIAYYDQESSQWLELSGTINTTSNTITASVSHFTTYAIMASTTELPPDPGQSAPAQPAADGATPPAEEPADSGEALSQQPASSPSSETAEAAPLGSSPIITGVIAGAVAGPTTFFIRRRLINKKKAEK